MARQPRRGWNVLLIRDGGCELRLSILLSIRDEINGLIEVVAVVMISEMVASRAGSTMPFATA